jgi:ribosomal protein L18
MSKTIVKRHSSQKSTRKTRSSLKTANLNRHKLSVFRSNKFIYAQIIDPVSGKSIAGVKGNNPEDVGAMMAEKKP